MLWATKAIHTRESPINRKPHAASACRIETTIKTLRRSCLSATGPPIGEAKNDGSENATNNRETKNFEPVMS